MKKDLPNVFANDYSGNIHNYQDIFKSDNNKKMERNYVDNTPVNIKINRIFNSNNFVYKADVEIELEDRIIEKTIVGKTNTKLLTMDNEQIMISKIKDIRKI